MSKDLQKKTFKSPSTADEIVAAIKNPPETPTETLFSRRRQAVEIRGDAIVFSLEPDTTHPKFVFTIKKAQQAIFDLIEKDLGLTEKKWPDKESRHKDKIYKRHKKLHIAFMGTISPCSIREYKEKKCEQTQERINQASQVLYDFLNQPKKIRGSVKECKLNVDGHIVVRVDIHNFNEIFTCKSKWEKIFGGSYNRYSDPEKQKTLAAVIGVVDYEKLSLFAKKNLEEIIKNLEVSLKKAGPIPLLGIEWIEYDKRTLSPNSRLSVRKFQRSLFLECRFNFFRPINEQGGLPCTPSPSIIREGVAILKQATDAISLPELKL